MLEAAFFGLWQIPHDPLGPLITPRQPSGIIRPLLRDQLRKAIEWRHGVDILRRAFPSRQLPLCLEPFQRCPLRVLRSWRGGIKSRVL